MKGLLIVLCAGLLLSGCSSTLNPAPVSDESISGKSQSTNESSATHKNNHKKKSQADTSTQSMNKPLPSEITQINWQWPISQYKSALYHSDRKGLDIEVTEHKIVHASASGVVSYVGDSLKSYGHMVVIKHSPDILSVYADNQKILVKEGDKIKVGQAIAELSPEAGHTSAILHFEIRYRGKPINPQRVLKNNLK
ncbi:M23 family metallopeptidase [Ferrovum sp. PN-J185]|uniref:M23 family metallopeptidase n=1 Tax=Ferrovum sp. PN-J185 TaxID=1356306 RepID=UPI00079675D6|nr:M23 family metallopeptidase [Ferrovum sp. PN-J185]KXW56696.1 murein hydrolase activator NlpD precursor [Ferrovum sp. PN-J185]MCC6067618.1 M23 family metallopeptidase [Ferrovum sp. PN-J185]MDE1892021.1 M23 family metallopeptidase [Betaproteobacteria bacterium]MDE2056530.1 M23 family metallopeptidase [Betaproteobacteria bacterium]